MRRSGNRFPKRQQWRPTLAVAYRLRVHTVPGFRVLLTEHALECERCSTRISFTVIERLRGSGLDPRILHGCAADSLTDDQMRAEIVRRALKGGPTLENIALALDDDELRAECERRNLISGDLAIVDLVRATDEGLRRECERRGIGFATLREYAGDTNLRVREEAKDRDSVRELYAAASNRCIELEIERDAARRQAMNEANAVERLLVERDEWKRRAEFAEAALTRADKEDRSKELEIRDLRKERGPGIAGPLARDTDHYFDPVDLLADDAP